MGERPAVHVRLRIRIRPVSLSELKALSAATKVDR